MLICWGNFRQALYLKDVLSFNLCGLSILLLWKLCSSSWEEALEGSPMYVFAAKLSPLKKCLIVWNKKHFGKINDNIINAKLL